MYDLQVNGAFLQAGMTAAHGVLGKSCTLLSNPRHMVPSLKETGARLFVARFLGQYISTGSMMWVHSYSHISLPVFASTNSQI